MKQTSKMRRIIFCIAIGAWALGQQLAVRAGLGWQTGLALSRGSKNRLEN